MKKFYTFFFFLLWCIITLILSISFIGWLPLLVMEKYDWFDFPKECLKIISNPM